MTLVALITLPVTHDRSISVNVTDGENAIGSVSVVFDNDTENTKTTGSAGGCTATLSDGEHTIVLSKEGYNTLTQTITVSSEDTSFAFVLEEI